MDGVLLAGVLVSGAARLLADTLASTTALVATVAFVLMLVSARTALQLPLAYAAELTQGRRYGRARLSTMQWLLGYAWRAAALAAVLTGAALVVQLAAWWSPSVWWAVAAAILAVALVGGAAMVPSLALGSASGVGPLRRAELSERLSALAERAGAAGVPVLEWRVGQGGPGSTAMLAGMGLSRRILVADAVLDTHADDEVEVIVAHELAHHRRGDAWWSAAMTAGAAAAGLYASARLLPVVAGALAIRGPADTAALPLVALACGVVAAVLAPVTNAVSRAQERRADRDALKWTGNAPALVRTLKRLSAEHLAEDRPPGWAEALFNRHPSVADRIAAAERWSEAVPQTAGRKPGA